MMPKTDHQNSPEHIGWDLWQASHAWKKRFRQEMVERGHSWYAEARGELFRFLSAEGIQQNDLATLSGLTKQAVQQHLDGLVRDGIVERIMDPMDARRRLVALTDRGLDAVRDSTRVKLIIEKEYAELLGQRTLETVKRALRKII